LKLRATVLILSVNLKTVDFIITVLGVLTFPAEAQGHGA
jgi:hypothetical protein